MRTWLFLAEINLNTLVSLLRSMASSIFRGFEDRISECIRFLISLLRVCQSTTAGKFASSIPDSRYRSLTFNFCLLFCNIHLPLHKLHQVADVHDSLWTTIPPKRQYNLIVSKFKTYGKNSCYLSLPLKAFNVSRDKLMSRVALAAMIYTSLDHSYRTHLGRLHQEAK